MTNVGDLHIVKAPIGPLWISNTSELIWQKLKYRVDSYDKDILRRKGKPLNCSNFVEQCIAGQWQKYHWPALNHIKTRICPDQEKAHDNR